MNLNKISGKKNWGIMHLRKNKSLSANKVHVLNDSLLAFL